MDNFDKKKSELNDEASKQGKIIDKRKSDRDQNIAINDSEVENAFEE